MNRLHVGKPAARRRGRARAGGGRLEESVDPGLLIDQAWDLCESGDYDKAYAKLRDVPPAGRQGRDYLLMMTLVCGELNKNRRMLAAARQLVETAPGVDYHWGFLGEAARRNGGIRAAVRIWHEALRRSPGLASVSWRLAGHYCIMGRLQRAREQLKVAFHLDPQLIAAAMDEPVFESIWETIAEAGPPPARADEDCEVGGGG